MTSTRRIFFVFSFACVAHFVGGCGKDPAGNAVGWTAQGKFAESEDGLGGGPFLYKWRDSILAWQALAAGGARCFVMDRNNNSWSEDEIKGLPRDTSAVPLIDEEGNRLLLQRGYKENEELLMHLSVVRITPNSGLKIESELNWARDKNSLFGETGSHVRLNPPGKREGAGIGGGLVSGSALHIPYSIDAKTYVGKTVSRTHFSNGIFYSVDSGKTWQMEMLSNFSAGAPAICSTKEYLYYFALRYPLPQHGLWFSRRSLDGGSWESPEMITKTLAHAYGHYVAAARDDMVHLCWLDGRHEQTRLSIDPYLKNYEVVYCHRKDSDNDWSKQIILSKGLLYAYSPSMSVEGDKIVIVWSGVRTGNDGHGEYGPNDIYYVTSRDGGKSWKNPLKVTDGAKDGITSGKPQVVLLNGVVHLIYVQGKISLRQESPGLTKLKQAPWPIYHQQRPFPD